MKINFIGVLRATAKFRPLENYPPYGTIEEVWPKYCKWGERNNLTTRPCIACEQKIIVQTTMDTPLPPHIELNPTVNTNPNSKYK